MLLALLTRPFRLIGLLVTIGLVVGGIWVWRSASSSDPVSADAALAAFRAEAGGAIPRGGPKAGVYTYRTSGDERGGAGPLAITRRVPSEARLVVSARADGWQAELSYSEQHVEGARYRLGAGGVRITWRRTKVTFAGFGRDDRRDVRPPSLFLPSRPAVGRSWRETYRTGDLTVRAQSRVTRTETVTVGGRSIPTLVVAVDSNTEGAHPGTRAETIWWAPSLGLPVRWDVDMDIGGTFAFRSTTSIRLASVTPRT